MFCYWFNVSVMSLAHVFINGPLSFYVFYVEQGIDDVFHGTTEMSVLLNGIACGYFFVDIVLSTYHLKVFGYGFFVHAVYCTLSFILGLVWFVFVGLF